MPENSIADNAGDTSERYKRAISGVEPWRTQNHLRKKVTIREKKERLLKVEQLVRLGMSVEQLQRFLPTWGIPSSRTTVYEYLQQIKLPRNYERTEHGQSHHDYFIFNSFIRIAEDARPKRTERLAKGSYHGARFRPDFTFWIDNYLFFMEMQLSDLVETRWRVKFRNYLKLYEDLKRPFRALFIIDQRGDMSYIRSYARKVLREAGRTDLNLFLFAPLQVFRRSDQNVASDSLWNTLWSSEKASLL